MASRILPQFTVTVHVWMWPPPAAPGDWCLMSVAGDAGAGAGTGQWAATGRHQVRSPGSGVARGKLAPLFKEALPLLLFKDIFLRVNKRVFES